MAEHVNIPKYPRKGTMRLLHLTADMPEDKKAEIMEYISRLEQREDYLVERIENFVNNMTSVRVA